MAWSSTAAMAASSQELTTTQLLDFCRSSTMAEAESKASTYGWRKMEGAVNSGWREGFLATNDGTVEIFSWQRSDDTEGLSFWIANGESRHRACSYSTKAPQGLLDSLKQELGTPTSVLNHDFGEVVFWTQGPMETGFSRVDSSATVTISYRF